MFLYAHLGLLALVVVVTAAVVIPNWGAARRPLGVVLIATLPFLVLGVLSALLLSAKGAPVIEWVLPMIGVLIAGVCCRSDRAFNGLRWGLFGLAIALWLNFGLLIRPGGGYTAEPAYSQAITKSIQTNEIKAAGEAMRAQLPGDATYPAGPVGKILDNPRFDAVDALAVRSEWHTPITRLHREVHSKAPLWYPGGEIASASQKLEARTR